MEIWRCGGAEAWKCGGVVRSQCECSEGCTCRFQCKEMVFMFQSIFQYEGASVSPSSSPLLSSPTSSPPVSHLQTHDVALLRRRHERRVAAAGVGDVALVDVHPQPDQRLHERHVRIGNLGAHKHREEAVHLVAEREG